jgi:hypothetical protein
MLTQGAHNNQFESEFCFGTVFCSTSSAKCRITSIGRYVEFGVEVINNEIQSIIKAAGTILEEGFWSLQHFKEKERFHLQSE